MPGYPHRWMLVFLALVWLLLVGCGACGGLGMAPHPPNRALPISEQAADHLVKRWKTAWQQAGQSNQIELQITEEELTSFLNLRLIANKKLPIVEPKVWFDPDGIYIEGQLNVPQIPLKPNVLLVLDVYAEDGNLRVDPTQGAIGSLPMPKAMLSTIDESLDTFLANAHANFAVQSLTLGEGTLTLTLSRR
ncbi:MAG: hypothetical protein J7M34_04730 [Anaerolineae bacterium]|nr:hypothetical protein [Anaerolineae bacterium]